MFLSLSTVLISKHKEEINKTKGGEVTVITVIFTAPHLGYVTSSEQTEANFTNIPPQLCFLVFLTISMSAVLGYVRVNSDR